MSLEDALAEFGHDARGSLGALRLAVTSLGRSDDDGGDESLLAAAEQEISRMAAALVALPTLALLNHRQPPATVGLGSTLRAVVEAARRYEIEVSVVTGIDRAVRTTAAIERVLLAVVVLAAGADETTQVTVIDDDGSVLVASSGARPWPQARRLVAHLVSIVDATLVDAPTGLVLRFQPGDG